MDISNLQYNDMVFKMEKLQDEINSHRLNENAGERKKVLNYKKEFPKNEEDCCLA